MYLSRTKLYFGAVAILFFVLFSLASLDYIDDQSLAELQSSPNTIPSGKASIIINVDKCVLELYNDGKLYKKYRIAVGKSSTPTPIGEWNIVWKDYILGDWLWYALDGA